MKVYVINLEKNQERRDYVSSQISVDFEFFPATYGIEKEHELRDRHQLTNVFKRLYKKQLSPAQLGCFDSHYRLWKKCIEINEPIIVTEDDGAFADSETQKKLVSLIKEKLNKYEFIRLEPTNEERKVFEQGVYEDMLFNIHILRKCKVSALAYALTPSAAKRLVDNADVWESPIDNYIGDMHKHHVDVMQMYPYFRLVNDNFESDIAGGEREMFSLFSRRLWKVYKKFDDARRHFYFDKRFRQIKKNRI